jgi:hypothetical protein
VAEIAQQEELRVRFPGAIGTNDRREIRVAEEEGMVALVGLEVW